MTAHESTQRAFAAVAAGDLDALAQALAARETALRIAPASEQAAALRDGAVLLSRLAEFKRTLAADYARWEQWRGGIVNYSAGPPPELSVDVCA